MNPWDYVLMLEGAATFACAATRRHQSNTIARASFPFTVGAVGAGWGGIEATDESDARAEFWAPLWSRPARSCEIEALFGEGRAVTNGRTARDGLEFARALATLGVSRGFSEFQRYGFYKRAGKNHYATAISRRRAAPSPGAELVADLDRGGWLNRARRLGRSDNQPATVRNAAKVLEDSLFELLAPDVSYRSVSAALEAIGRFGELAEHKPQRPGAAASPAPALTRMATSGRRRQPRVPDRRRARGAWHPLADSRAIFGVSRWPSGTHRRAADGSPLRTGHQWSR